MSSIRSTPLKAGLFAFVLLAASLLLNSLPAQDATTPAAAPDAGGAPGADTGAAAPVKPVTIGDMLSNGGPVMYVLAIASVCLVWFTVEGFVILRAVKLAPPVLIVRIREAFKAGNYQEAWNICKANKCFLSNVLANGLERIGRSKDAVDFVVEETALREANDLKTNTTYLSVIGVVSPMIGLTGTVWGMIGAFRALGQNGITNPSVLAGKIGEVLIATMSGLVVAVPAFVFFYILRARAQSAILHAESQVYRLLDDVPYEQLSGVRIGENASAGASAKSRAMRSGVSQKVSPNVTTNCPSCNAPITVGTTPCPNCQTALDWGTSEDLPVSSAMASSSVKRQRKRKRMDTDGDPEFQVAPMVDVLLVLMLFFMAITSTEVLKKVKNLQLADAKNAKPDTHTHSNEILVNVQWSGVDNVARYSLDGVDYATANAMEGVLAAQHSQNPSAYVVIRADRSAEYSYISDLMGACAKAGISTVSFAVLVGGNRQVPSATSGGGAAN